jgi:hypothetical protein
MSKRKKIQRWDEVNGLVIEDGGSIETPEEQAEGPALTNPVRENPLKNAEMETEDDYNQIDGFINNGEKKDPEEELLKEQKSVKEKLLENEKKLKEQIHEPPLIHKDPLCPDRNLC